MSLNSGTYEGNLTRDPEFRNVKGDKRVVRFGVALNRYFKKGDEKVKETVFIECEAWDTGADVISSRFRKGDPITVETSLKQEDWVDKTDGKSRSRLVFRVERFHFARGYDYDQHGWSAGQRGETQPAKPEKGEKPAPSGNDGSGGDEEIPF